MTKPLTQEKTLGVVKSTASGKGVEVGGACGARDLNHQLFMDQTR